MPPAAIMLRVVLQPQVSAPGRVSRSVVVEAPLTRAIMLRAGSR